MAVDTTGLDHDKAKVEDILSFFSFTIFLTSYLYFLALCLLKENQMHLYNISHSQLKSAL